MKDLRRSLLSKVLVVLPFHMHLHGFRDNGGLGKQWEREPEVVGVFMHFSL